MLSISFTLLYFGTSFNFMLFEPLLEAVFVKNRACSGLEFSVIGIVSAFRQRNLANGVVLCGMGKLFSMVFANCQVLI